jgi:hypothetical protein
MVRRLAVVALIANLALAGCATAITSGPGASPPVAPADLVLRERTIVGFMAPQARFAGLPSISVYGDGRVITTAPQPAIYPGPARPGLQIQTLSASDVVRLRDLAAKAGVGSGIDLGSPPVTDMPSTRFLLRTDGQMVETTAYALGDPAEAELTPPQRAARAALLGLDHALRDLGATLGSVPPPVPYEPAGVVVIAQDWADDSLPASPAVAWPGPALPGQYLGDGLTCVTASGTTADAVFAAAARADERTPWTSGGKRWMLSLRPLLPDENTCSDIIG